MFIHVTKCKGVCVCICVFIHIYTQSTFPRAQCPTFLFFSLYTHCSKISCKQLNKDIEMPLHDTSYSIFCEFFTLPNHYTLPPQSLWILKISSSHSIKVCGNYPCFPPIESRSSVSTSRESHISMDWYHLDGSL